QNSLGNLIGFNGTQPIAGKVTVREIYGEALVPLVADVTGIKYLGLELGARLSNYSSVGDVETWKAGGEWAINDYLRIRGMYNKATRAPSVFELFRAGDQNFPGYADPCRNAGGVAALNGTAVAPASAGFNFCANWIGLDPLDAGTPATLGTVAASDTQVEAFLFGNSSLDPEESETYTIGAVVQAPTPFGDFSASVDYYNIEITDYIQFPTANVIIQRCVATLDLTSDECLKTPRIGTGQLGGVQIPIENTAGGGGIQTSGVDVAVTYSLVPEDIGLPIPGSLDVSALVSYLEEWHLDGGGVNGGDYTGIALGLGGIYPEWKSTVRTTYSYNDWQFSWQWERIGELDDYGLSTIYPTYYPALEAVNYHDFSIRWFATESIDATFVCENCFDKQPQDGSLSGYLAGPNVDASTYDVLGRYYRFSLRARF
ncbi:MAG: TonB-dependent receptor, partial [Pseudomonadota bacterium]|nr:TonB-dependent receptor [Pseudomonadota bacterium]